MDINQKLIAAFQVEHIEHLEGIRACLARWKQAGEASDVNEAFRHAHSLKGAARVTGFTPVEMLAHRLESLLALVRDGALAADERLLRAAHAALDASEDAAAALLAGRAPPDVQAVVADLEAAARGNVAAGPRSAGSATLKEKLQAAFQEEYHAHVAGIRRVLDEAQQPDAAAGRVDSEEAFRCANSLKGAARLAEAPAVELLAERLETLFSRARRGELTLDAARIGVARQVLAAMNECAGNGQTTAPPAVLAAFDRLLSSLPADPAAASESSRLRSVPAPGRPALARAPQAIETVRLSAESLDRLLQSTGQLLTESLQQDSLGRELSAISRQIATIEREWESLQRAAAGPLRRFMGRPELASMGRSMGFIEHELGALVRAVRAARLKQQRSSWSLQLLGTQLEQDVRQMRMVPAESEFQGFRKMMRDLARDEAKQIEFRAHGFEVLADRMVLQALKDPLMHVLRNAVSHGVETPEERLGRGKSPTATVTLEIQAVGSRLSIAVEDDGRGIDLARVAEVAARKGLLADAEAGARSPQELARFLFQPGFSTAHVVTELAGRGMGLSTVYETVTRLQGELELRPREGGGTVLLVSVPLSVATHRLLLVTSRGQTFAIPAYGIEGLHRVKLQELETVEGQPMVNLDKGLTPLTTLDRLFGSGQAEHGFEADKLLLAVLRSGPKRVAVAVDALLAERNALIKSLGPPADRVAAFMGGVLLEDGSVSLVLNPAELVERFKPSQKAALFRPGKPVEEPRPPTILVVDDSFTTRTLETSILETNGYRVRVAVDGVEALEQLRSEKIDLVISDIEMPRLDGFGLLEELKRDSRLGKIPVIIVSSFERREDQERGLRLGADAYIVKRKFDHQDLLKTVQQIL